jgi:hypothetical protein
MRLDTPASVSHPGATRCSLRLTGAAAASWTPSARVHAMGARQNRVAECDADLHAAGGGLGDREPPFPLEVAQRADRLKRLPQRSRPRTPPGDGGYDEGLGERGRRDPVRRGLLLGSRSGRPSPVRTQALMAQVPESARIRPQLRWQQEPPKMAACRGFMFGSAQRPPGNRQDGHPEHKTAANRQPSDLRDRCTGWQGRSHQSTTNALQIVGIMELGGLEPPTSWVRSTRSSPLARPKSAGVAGVLGGGRLARSARIVVDSRRLPLSQALLAISA